MSSNLDKTLDEIIRDNRASTSRGGGGFRDPLDEFIRKNRASTSRCGGGFRGRGHGGAASSGLGPVRGSSIRRHSPPFWPDKVPETRWEHDLYYENQMDLRVRAPEGFQVAPSTTISDLETETKLCISNLDHNISMKKIGELISEVGGWKKYSLHCDESGESRVRAEVVYSRRRDAEEAMEKYNNVELDGKPMKIKIVGGNVSTPVHLPAPVAGSSVHPDWAPRTRKGLGREQGQRRQGRNRGETVTVEELDADLDRYKSEAMQTD